MNTNSISIPYLNEVLAWNDQLGGLPALPLIFVGCLGLGYLLKAIAAFDNRYIPRWVISFAVIANLAIAPKAADMSLRVWSGRTIVLGIITAAFAWMMHHFLLKRLEKKFGWFDDEPKP